MQIRTLVGLAVITGAVAVSTVATASVSRKVGVFNFMRPTMVAGTIVSGHTVIVHDDAKMARGEPCTTVYHYDGRVPTREGEEIVSFHCTPASRPVVKTAQAVSERALGGIDELREYQLAGDVEAHLVPSR